MRIQERKENQTAQPQKDEEDVENEPYVVEKLRTERKYFT